MDCVLGIDVGTTSTVGIIIRFPNEVLGIISKPVNLVSRKAGWAEEDPEQWWANVRSIIADFLKRGFPASAIRGVGVTGMLPAIVLLDADGQIIRPSIQQSDGRCGDEVEEMKAEVDPSAFVLRTGNGVNQQLVGAKIRWIEKHEPEVFSRTATVFGSYDYINWRLTGVRAIEQNWALEGGFIDLALNEVADDLVRLAHIPRDALPPKSVSHSILGHVTERAAIETGLLAGTPVVGGAADLIASALGAGVTRRGDVLLKFGGSVDILTATDRVAPDRRLYLDYHLVPGLYMPNGCMATGGSGLNWFVDTFAASAGAEARNAGVSVHRRLDQLAGEIPAGADGLIVLPYFLGEKTPIHNPNARGVFSGLSFSHGLGHLWRAMLEAYAYALKHHVEVLNDIGHPTENYFASDGGSNSSVWMQIVSDILLEPVRLLRGHPGSCLGAAWTAAVGVGLTQDWSGVSVFVQHGDLIQPHAENAEVYAKGYRLFRDLYRRIST
jgi:xylulokinase